MTAMVAGLSGLTPINTINWLEYQSGQEITRPWSFAVNGVAQINQFLANAGLAGDGTMDFRGVAMPWDALITFSDGTPIGNIYRFSWTSQLDSVTVQPANQLRKMSRAVGVSLLVTLEEYVIDDVDLLLSKFSPFLAIKGGTDQTGAVLTAYPSIDINIRVQDNQFAATA